MKQFTEVIFCMCNVNFTLPVVRVVRLEVYACLSVTGLRNRAIASHNMNEYSSRSHTILTVSVNSEQKVGSNPSALFKGIRPVIVRS